MSPGRGKSPTNPSLSAVDMPPDRTELWLFLSTAAAGLVVLYLAFGGLPDFGPPSAERPYGFVSYDFDQDGRPDTRSSIPFGAPTCSLDAAVALRSADAATCT